MIRVKVTTGEVNGEPVVETHECTTVKIDRSGTLMLDTREWTGSPTVDDVRFTYYAIGNWLRCDGEEIVHRRWSSE